MDFTTGEPSEEALSQLIESLIRFLEEEQFQAMTAPRGEKSGQWTEGSGGASSSPE